MVNVNFPVLCIFIFIHTNGCHRSIMPGLLVYHMNFFFSITWSTCLYQIACIIRINTDSSVCGGNHLYSLQPFTGRPSSRNQVTSRSPVWPNWVTVMKCPDGQYISLQWVWPSDSCDQNLWPNLVHVDPQPNDYRPSHRFNAHKAIS